MRMIEAGYILTDTELLLLSTLTGSDRLLGFQYDHMMDFERDLQGIWNTTGSILEFKNFIYDGLNGSMAVDKQLMRHIEAVTKPEYCISARFRANGTETSCYYYISAHGFAKLENNTTHPGEYILTPINSIKWLKHDIKENMDFERKYENSRVFEIPLSTQDMECLMDNNLDIDYLMKLDFIVNSGIDQELLFDLSDAVRRRENMKTLMAFKIEQKILYYGGLLTYGGIRHLWRLDKDNTVAGLKFYLFSSDAFNQSLISLLSQIH